VPGPGTASTSYSASLAATGGVVPLAYAITGALPTGLTLNASSGGISGIPTKSGTFPFSLTATDNYGDMATQGYSINISPAPASTFAIVAPASEPAGTSFNFTVTAYDADGNIATGYPGTVKFTSSDTKAVLPANATLTNGTGTFAATFKTAGAETITATDSTTASITGTSNNTTVSPLAASKLAVSGPATATAGTAFNVTVTAEDIYGNTVTTFSDKVNLTSSDGSAILPASSGLISGTGTFPVTLKTTGSQTVTGTDATNGAIAGVTGTIAVSPAAANRFTVVAPAASVAGASLALSVTAYDSYNNVATNYTGTVKFTSTDAKASLPANATLTSGTGSFSATLKTVGSQTITGTDTATASITGTSSAIVVSPAVMSQLLVTAPSSATAGTAFSVTVTAADAYANVIGGYTGTVHFTSSDTASGVVLPANYTFTAANSGSYTFANGATLITAGSRTITATDTANAGFTGSAAVTVNAAAATKLVVSAPGTATAGTAINVTVTAEDTYGNTVTTFADKVNFTSTDSAAALPVSSGLTNGTGTFPVTLKTAGSQTVTGTDASKGTITGTTGAIAVSAASASHFQVSAPASASAGASFSVAVTALDPYGNIASAYAGTVKITSSDSQASLPPSSALSNGTGSFAVTLKTTPTQTVTATDSANASISGISGSISVSPGITAKLSVVAPATVTTAVAFNFTVTAIDAYGNTTPNYGGTVQFSSSDATAPLPTLPTSSTLSSGTKSFSATFASNGTWTITATDTAIGTITGTSGSITASTVLTITTTSLNSLDVGQTPTQVLTAAGGSGNSANYAWSWAAQGSSSIPPGLTVNAATGALTGSPTTAGSYNVTVKVVDSGITPNQTATANFTITIYGALTLSSTLPTGYVGVNYSGSVTGAGGSNQGDLSLTVVSGLPSDGLSTSPNGPGALNIGGPPSNLTTPYTVNFTMKLADSATNASISQGFSITVNSSTYVLPTSNPPAAVDGQAYGDTITANIAGGSGNYAWIINGTQIASNTPTALGTAALSQQFFAVDSGTSVLTLQTASSTTVTGTGTFTFTAAIKDIGLNQTSATQTYTFTVNPAGSTVSGQFFLNNYCYNGNNNLPVTFTVGLYNGATLVQSQTTDVNGNYSFSSIPNGTYSIEPSLPGAATLFYPTSITGLALNSATNNNVQGENFNANVGFTVSGTVSYSGSQAGQTYLSVNNNNCGGNGGPGTSITETVLKAGGAYTIRGVPPGSVSISAWMDPIGQGQPNATDPTGSVAITVDANVSNADLTMADPTFATPTENPQITNITPNPQGALIQFTPSQNSNGVEDANGYWVQWSTSTALGGGSGGGQFACAESGNTCPHYVFEPSGKNGVWLLTNALLAGTGYSFTSGQTYYFQARSYDSLDGDSHPSGWCNYTMNGCSDTTAADFIGVTIGTPACTGTCATVTSSVTIPNTITINKGAPLYLGLIQLSGAGGNPTAFYVTEIASPVIGANQFTVTVPTGQNYIVLGVLDQDNNGGVGAGSINNVRGQIPSSDYLTITASTTSVPGITLSGANSLATISTQWSSYSCNGCGSTSTSYQLNFEVEEGAKLPVAVTITSGPNMINTSNTVAIDMGNNCQGCGNPQFQYSVMIPGGTPNVGDTYDFTVTYLNPDGTTSQDTGSTVNGAVTGWDGGTTIVGASDAPSALAPNNNSSTSTTPTFTWTDSSSSIGSDFDYNFYLSDQTSCSGSCTIWQIPSQNSKSNGFSSSILSITWGIDPTGDASNTPSVGKLTPGDIYNWTIQVQDPYNNQAQTSVWYQP
jgi:hypothetical protein